jgi:hypothetical protein
MGRQLYSKKGRIFVEVKKFARMGRQLYSKKSRIFVEIQKFAVSLNSTAPVTAPACFGVGTAC